MTENVELIQYGNVAEQFFEWYAADLSVTAKGTVVLVHGGFWRQRHKLDQMHSLAAYFLKAGWAVANIEYRRADCGGEWPFIIDDVKAAFKHIRQHAQQKGITGPVIGVGHSVGGQLVLLAAEEQDLVIALAPVTDVMRANQEGLGEQAAQAFFGDITLKLHQQASPIEQLPLHTKVLLIHGTEDQRVPLTHSQDFILRLRAEQGRVDYWEVNQLDHFFIIDPNCEIWPKVMRYINSI